MAQGYAGKILRINLSTREITSAPTETYTEKFLGGRGIAAKIHWDEVPDGIDAYDPENRLVVMTGPAGGVPGLAASRWQVSGKSPIFNQFSYCNLGGSWGAQLKFAGYDGLIVHGKSDKLLYLFIENDTVELRDAADLKGKGAIETRQVLKDRLGSKYRVLTIGPAGENGVRYSILLADADSSGSNGLGSVMGTKNLKAIVVKGDGKIEVADKDKLSALRKRVKELKPGPGTWPTMLPQENVTKDLCFGCINGCMRSNYNAEDGDSGKYICQSALFYEIRAQRYYGEVTEVSYKANKLCDDLGMDTRNIETMIMWLSRCNKAGVITEEESGIPFSKIGSLEFIETLLNMIAHRQGLGDLLAEGAIKAAEVVGQNSDQFITDYMTASGENSVYGARMYLATGLLYAMEPRMPIQQLHEISTQCIQWAANHMGLTNSYMTSEVFRKVAKRMWGDEIAADYSTYDGKALCAARIQDRQNAKECVILCDFSWPIMHSPLTEDHMGDLSLDSQVASAVTGYDIDEEGLYEIGRRTFNLQRAILNKEGKVGREADALEEFNFTAPLRGDYGNPECLVPGKDGEVFSRKGMVVDRDEFERMKDEYYDIRGWDVASGLQTRASLEALGMGDVADGLEKKGLLA